MSIILDALRKSENERQTHGATEFATVPGSSGSSPVPRWTWIIGSLLVINLVVLAGLLLKPDSKPELPVPIREIVAIEPRGEAVQPGFADQVAVARRDASAEKETPITNPPSAATAPAILTATGYLEINEARVRGLITISDLHLDIHVYSSVPKDRFVFINMSKYREGSYLEEGPAVIEITPDGVVLDYQGTSFLLPRE